MKSATTLQIELVYIHNLLKKARVYVASAQLGANPQTKADAVQLLKEIDAELNTYGSPHFNSGGDGITNFFPPDVHIYCRAIAAYGDPNLYIGLPMPGGMVTDLALRRRGDVRDLSQFWKIFELERTKRANDEK